MPGAPDPRYVLARTVLLDALEALGDQRSAVIVVGAVPRAVITVGRMRASVSAWCCRCLRSGPAVGRGTGAR